MAGQLADAISNTIEYLSQNIAVLILNGVLGITMEFFKFFILLLLVLAAAYLIIIYPYNTETSCSTEEDSLPKETVKQIAVNPLGTPLVDLLTNNDPQVEHQQIEQEEQVGNIQPEQITDLNNSVEELEGIQIDNKLMNDLSEFYADSLQTDYQPEEATETEPIGSISSQQTEFFTPEEHNEVVVMLENESKLLDETINMDNKELKHDK